MESTQNNNTIHSVSVVIPARNEEATIGMVLDDLHAVIGRYPRYYFELIVVIDSKNDPTGRAARDKGARVVCNRLGGGKGAALGRGFEVSKGDVIVMLDADGSHNPCDIGIFLEAIENGSGLAIGSRVVGGSDDHNTIRLFGNAVFTLICLRLPRHEGIRSGNCNRGPGRTQGISYQRGGHP